MEYQKRITLKDGRECLLRHGEKEDAKEFISYFSMAHGETDFLTTYPDEAVLEEAKEASFLEETKESPRSAEICAFVDGVLVGSAGISPIRERDKMRHRAEFGISVLRAYWGLGIGKALTDVCLDLAGKAGYLQVELEVVSENEAAVWLYRKMGFSEYGRNPKGFLTREGKWQTLVLMRKEME